MSTDEKENTVTQQPTIDNRGITTFYRSCLTIDINDFLRRYLDSHSVSDDRKMDVLMQLWAKGIIDLSSHSHEIGDLLPHISDRQQEGLS